MDEDRNIEQLNPAEPTQIDHQSPPSQEVSTNWFVRHKKLLIVLGVAFAFIVFLGLLGSLANDGESSQTAQSKIKKPHLGTVLSSKLANSEADDGWQSVLSVNQDIALIPPEQIVGTLYEEPTEMIRLETKGAGTASIIKTNVVVPKNTSLFTFCFDFPKGGDGDWLTLHFSEKGSLEEADLLWTMRGDTASYFGVNIHGDTFMLDSTVPAAHLPGREGTLYFTLNGFGEKPAEARLTEFHFLTNKDVRRRARRDPIEDCLINRAPIEDEISGPSGNPIFNNKLSELLNAEKVLNPVSISFVTKKLAIINPELRSLYGETFSSDGKRVVYSGRTDPMVAKTERQFLGDNEIHNYRSQVVFSADGQSYAYIKKESGSEGKEKTFVVIDESKREIPDYTLIRTFGFVPGTNSTYFVGVRNKKYRTVINGIEGKKYDKIEEVTFSPDGKRLVYIAHEGDEVFMVEGSKESKRYRFIEKLIKFSDDSSYFAFQATILSGSGILSGNKYRLSMIANGVEGPFYEWIGGWLYSDNGKFLIYTAQEDGKEFIVVADERGNIIREGKKHRRVPRKAISYNGERTAYSVEELGKNDKQFVVLDNQEGIRYDSVSDLTFSPDGSAFAYVAKDKTKNASFVVKNGKESAHYDAIKPVLFSDNNTISFRAKRGAKWLIVKNDVEGKAYDEVSFPKFIPNTNRIYYKATKNGKQTLVIGQKEMGLYDKIYEETVTFNDNYTKVAFGAKRSSELWWIAEDI